MLLDLHADCNEFASSTQLISLLGSSPEFVTATASHTPPCLWRLIRALCTKGGNAITNAWAAAEAIASHPEGLVLLLPLLLLSTQSLILILILILRMQC